MLLIVFLCSLLSNSGLRACLAPNLDYIGDGWCDWDNVNATGSTVEYNNPACNYDGGDCCKESCRQNQEFACGHNGFYCLDETIQRNSDNDDSYLSDFDDDTIYDATSVSLTFIGLTENACSSLALPLRASLSLLLQISLSQVGNDVTCFDLTSGTRGLSVDPVTVGDTSASVTVFFDTESEFESDSNLREALLDSSAAFTELFASEAIASGYASSLTSLQMTDVEVFSIMSIGGLAGDNYNDDFDGNDDEGIVFGKSEKDRPFMEVHRVEFISAGAAIVGSVFICLLYAFWTTRAQLLPVANAFARKVEYVQQIQLGETEGEAFELPHASTVFSVRKFEKE